MSLRASKVRLCGIAIGLGLVGCDTGVDYTSPAFHESAGNDPPPIGPFFSFSTYLGGNGADQVLDVISTAGQSPRVFAVGSTASFDFPTTDGTDLDPLAPAGCAGCPQDAFVTRLDGPGTIAWSTMISGPGFEAATAVAVALDLDVFVGGSAASLPAAATAGAADPTFSGGATPARGPEDGFVCRLDGATGAIEWCTFVGGDGPGGVLGLVADPSGDGVIAILTTSAGETLDPVYAAAMTGRHRATPLGADVLLVRIANDGGSFSWATYVGGSGSESGPPSLARNAAGLHVVTRTDSTDAPTPNGFATAPGGVYYAHLSNDAATLRYATYLGGAGDRVEAHAVATDSPTVWIGLTTTTPGLPTTTAAVQPTYAGAGTAPGCATDGDGDGWLVGLTPAASGAASLVAATYLGGSLGDRVAGVSANAQQGAVTVTGRTHSSDFPVSGPMPIFPSFTGTPCASLPGNADGFAVTFDFGLTTRLMATYLGGTGVDALAAAANGRSGGLDIFAGTTRSIDFPLSRPVRNTLGGASDGVIAAIGFWPPPPPVPGDAGHDGTILGTDAGTPDPDDDDSGCCGAAPDPASRNAALVLALATLAAIARKRRATRRAG